LDKTEFERIVHIGLGRAILHLQTHDSTPYREILLHACTHSTAYDPQIEGSRARYTYDLIPLTNEVDFYRRAALNALAQSSKDHDRDAEFLFELARMFAEDGDQEARQAMYDKYRQSIAQGYDTGASQLIELDGIDGLVFVLAPDGKPIFSRYKPVEYERYIWHLQYRDGEGKAAQALDKVSLNFPLLAPLIYAGTQSLLRQDKRVKYKSQVQVAKNFSYEALRDFILEHDGEHMPSFSWALWGKQTTRDNLKLAAADLLREQKPEHLLPYLEIFTYARFPLDPSGLIKLALSKTDAPTDDGDSWLSKEDRVVIHAIRALKNISHPDVRALAFQMMESSFWKGQAAGLLTKNWQESDWQFLQRLSGQNLETEEYHSLVMSIRDIFQAHPSRAAAPTLLTLYERGPCSHCRQYIVEYLHSLGAMPDWMIEECRHDSYGDTREWVEGGFIDIEK